MIAALKEIVEIALGVLLGELLSYLIKRARRA